MRGACRRPSARRRRRTANRTRCGCASALPAANAGQSVADDLDVDVEACLDEPLFVGSDFGGSPGFGGPETLFEHGGGVIGALELTPHGDMHMAVGGVLPRGFMSSFNTAGLDALFWLHHANIDRLWTVWLKRDASHRDPTQGGWLTGVSFELHDENGAVVAMTASQVTDSENSRFGYRYQDESDPWRGRAARGAGATRCPGAGGAAFRGGAETRKDDDGESTPRRDGRCDRGGHEARGTAGHAPGRS